MSPSNPGNPSGKNNPARKKPNSGATGRKRSGSAGSATGGQRRAQGKTGPRNGNKRSAKKKGGLGKKIAAWTALFVAVCVTIPLVAFAVAYSTTTVPEPDELVNNQVATIVQSDGKTEIARVVPENGNRRTVSLDEIPVHVQNAVLAAEDREFWTNPGFSLTGYGRAALGVLTGKSGSGGGSTITQQYVKNAIVGNDHSYARKAKELVMSAKMANEWSKEEVLAAYLNTIYFGRNSYGIAAAAQAYFNKPIEKLTLEEGAVLAASIQRPSQLDPWTNKPEAQQRWNYVLDGMVGMGVLDSAKRQTAKYPKVADPEKTQSNYEVKGTNGLIRDRVLGELTDIGITEQQLNTKGLKITTTIDQTVQQSVINAVTDNTKGLADGVESAAVTMDPRTGAILGYFGGRDPNGWDYANSGLQTGSTFKIFGLAAGLAQDIPLSAIYDSSPVQTGDATVQNVGGQSCGSCSISEALKLSLNTSFIRYQKDFKNGPSDTAAMAHKLGVAESLPGVEHTLQEANGHSYEGVILGQYQSRPIDMASGLSTLANQGVYHKPHFISKVEDSQGEVLYEYAKEEKPDQRVSAAVANNVMDAMVPIAQYSGTPLAGGRQSAAKTGTAQLGDTGANKDAWMIGATPQLATAVWVGSTNGQPLVNEWGGMMYGAGTPASIWKQVMDTSLANQEFETFPTPEAIGGQAGRYEYVAPAPAKPGTDGADESSSSSESSRPGSPSRRPGAPGRGNGDRPGNGNGNAPAPEPAPAPAPQPGIDQFLNDLGIAG